MPGIHHVTAISGDPVKNLSFYTRDLGLRFVKKTVNFDDPSTYHFYYGDEGRGSVHHIAFRAADDVQQAKMTETLIRTHGRHPTEQKDRKYFRSIYFREPGGVLFEIATDIPGFAVDEPVEALGRHLELPSFLESRRKEIESALPVLETAAS